MCVVASFLNCGADRFGVGERGTSTFQVSAGGAGDGCGGMGTRTDGRGGPEGGDRGRGRGRMFARGSGWRRAGRGRGRRARGPAAPRRVPRAQLTVIRGTAERAIARRAGARTLSTATPTPASMMNRSERRLMVARLERLSVCHIASARPPSESAGPVVFDDVFERCGRSDGASSVRLIDRDGTVVSARAIIGGADRAHGSVPAGPLRTSSVGAHRAAPFESIRAGSVPRPPGFPTAAPTPRVASAVPESSASRDDARPSSSAPPARDGARRVRGGGVSRVSRLRRPPRGHP